MKLKTVVDRWLAQPATREEAIQRSRAIAAREAVAAVIMLAAYFTVPLWASDEQASQFSALFLAVSGLLAILAGATVWGSALLKRDMYY